MKINVVYYSFTGNTLAMVKAFEKGLKEAGAEYNLYSVVELKNWQIKIQKLMILQDLDIFSH